MGDERIGDPARVALVTGQDAIDRIFPAGGPPHGRRVVGGLHPTNAVLLMAGMRELV